MSFNEFDKTPLREARGLQILWGNIYLMIPLFVYSTGRGVLCYYGNEPLDEKPRSVHGMKLDLQYLDKLFKLLHLHGSCLFLQDDRYSEKYSLLQLA